MTTTLPVSSLTSIDNQASRLPNFRTISDASAFIGALPYTKNAREGRIIGDLHVNNFEGISVDGLAYMYVHVWASVLINDPKNG